MKITRRQFLHVSAGAATAALTGCDDLRKAHDYLGFGVPKVALEGPLTAPAGETIDAVSHVLNRLCFGPRPGDHARVTAMGVPQFLEEQLAPEAIDDRVCEAMVRRFEGLAELADGGSRRLEKLTRGQLFAYEQTMTAEMFESDPKALIDELTSATILRAVFSRRQLYEQMVQFWSDHFNIDHSKADCRWLKAADDWFVVRRHAMGRFPDMLRASALSPAMLWYLDGRVNQREKPTEEPNENYARELLELHTMGVHGGYTQQDVMEVARCLTGWTVRGAKDTMLGIGKVEFKRELHDDGDKVVLGQMIASSGGAGDLDRVLEIIALHPSTARYLATKLCRFFIADEPPEAAIAATQQAYLSSQGEIREMLRALFTTPEFMAARGVKLKRPFTFVASALRATNAETNARRAMIEHLLRMGHAPFRFPTPDGYPMEATHWTGTLLWRWNFAVALSENQITGTRIDLPQLREKLGGDDALMATLLGRRPSAVEARAFHESGAGLALLLASPAFQKC